MPVELAVYFGDGSDTTIKVMNDANNQRFSFTLSNQPHSVEFDPNNEIVLKLDGLKEDVNEYTGDDALVELYQNTPDPFTGKTQIAFSLPSAMPVKIVIYDITGKTVCEIPETVMSPGRQQVEFDASGLKKGMYYYSLETGHRKIVKKMMVK
jgi:hypothetical protein